MKRPVVLTLAATLLSLALSGIAWAHPAYKASNPGKDTTVSEAPSEVWVEFTESIEGGQVEVFGPCGEQVDNHDSTQNLTNDRITVSVSAHHAGTYRVHWDVLGADSHRTQGDFTFAASGGHACPGEEEETVKEPRDPDPKPKQQEDQRVSIVEPQDDDSEDRVRGTREQRSAPDSRAAQRDPKPRSNGRRDVVAQAPDPRPTGGQRGDRGIWDGIPIGDFLISLLVAAMIGAAGGRIYAGILGPKA
jgi:copper resistance protein C